MKNVLSTQIYDPGNVLKLMIRTQTYGTGSALELNKEESKESSTILVEES